MTANKPMTGEQLDELMTVAVNMQRDAETDCNRPSAMFAYAVQVAVLELRKARNDVAALAAENAGLKAANAEGCKWDGEQWVGISIETQATDAFLAEVRAQGVEIFAAHKRERQQALRSRSMRMSEEAAGMAADAEDFADQIRKGVQS
ncbi:MAG: hypothetical protein E6260_20185 [Enterobacter roggenkampii]|nr:hypothetical protein [Enterobacter roggenkampii]